MSTANSYGGWVSESQATGDAYRVVSARPATGGMSSIVRMVGALAVAWYAFSSLSGTGDVLSRERTARSANHVSLGGWSLDVTTTLRTPSENLARIREILNPAVSDLASAIGVSRQSVYNWLNGGPVADDNAGKLKDLADAADVLTREGVTVNSALLKRKFASGKNLLQVVQAGESAKDAALKLSVIYKREAAQRERMNAKFASKSRVPSAVDFDLPEAGESV